MHALAPTFNPSLQVHVLPDMKCDGGSVSRLTPISLQEGVCWSEAPLHCTKGPYMAKPCSPVLIANPIYITQCMYNRFFTHSLCIQYSVSTFLNQSAHQSVL